MIDNCSWRFDYREQTQRHDRIPVLDRIPYLGSLFRSTVTNRSRSELIILMCPEVTMTNLELHKLREKVEDHTHFGPRSTKVTVRIVRRGRPKKNSCPVSYLHRSSFGETKIKSK
jgi:type II secretory pathway component GspD/PulD (secretin)